jgi:hypothetical protein
MSKSNSYEMARHIGILERLVTDLLDKRRPDIPDLIYSSWSLLSSGFRYVFSNQYLIIFIFITK